MGASWRLDRIGNDSTEISVHGRRIKDFRESNALEIKVELYGQTRELWKHELSCHKIYVTPLVGKKFRCNCV